MEYANICRIHPLLVRTLKVILPFIVVAAQVAVLYLFLDRTPFLIIIGLMAAYVLPPSGKETVIPAGIALGIPWWLIAVSIMMIDLETALFMGWNFDLALKIPWLGGIMESFIEKARDYIREHPWLQRFYFTGIVVLVMVPVLGSGGIRGSIIGQLLGMQKIPVFVAIVTGAFIGCFGIALAALFLKELFMQSILLGTAAAGILVIIVGGVFYRRAHRKPAHRTK